MTPRPRSAWDRLWDDPPPWLFVLAAWTLAGALCVVFWYGLGWLFLPEWLT